MAETVDLVAAVSIVRSFVALITAKEMLVNFRWIGPSSRLKRSTALLVAVVAATLGWSLTAAPAVAQEAKSVVVVSICGYDELRSDLDFIGKLSDFPELANSMDGLVSMFTQFQGLAGLDKTKPWGGAALIGPQGFQTLVFLPVNDLKKLLAALGQLVGQPQDVGDGVKQLLVNNNPVFVKQVGNWAFLAPSPDQLANPPADPLKLLGKLPADYDLAVQANIQNVPPPFRQMAIDQIKAGMQAGLERQDGETDAQFETRTKMMQQQLQQLTTAINELETLTLGYATDARGKRAYFDVTMTAVAGSSLSKQVAAATTSSTKFSGFMNDDFVLQALLNSKMDPSEAESTVTMLKSLRSTMLDQIANSDEIKDPEEKKAVQTLAEESLDVLEATVRTGVQDAGLALVGEGPFTLVVGAGVQGGDRIEKALKKLFELAKKKPDDVEVTWNAAKHKGVTFHTLVADWPEDDDSDQNAEQVQAFFGDEINLTVGFSKDRIYLAFGEDGIDTIKEIIDASADTSPPKSPITMILSLSPLFAFAADQDEDNDALANLADALEETEKDKLRLTGKQVPNGVSYRFEVEEGVLKAIGTSAKAAQQGAAAGAR